MGRNTEQREKRGNRIWEYPVAPHCTESMEFGDSAYTEVTVKRHSRVYDSTRDHPDVSHADDPSYSINLAHLTQDK